MVDAYGPNREAISKKLIPEATTRSLQRVLLSIFGFWKFHSLFFVNEFSQCFYKNFSFVRTVKVFAYLVELLHNRIKKIFLQILFKVVLKHKTLFLLSVVIILLG